MSVHFTERSQSYVSEARYRQTERVVCLCGCSDERVCLRVRPLLVTCNVKVASWSVENIQTGHPIPHRLMAASINLDHDSSSTTTPCSYSTWEGNQEEEEKGKKKKGSVTSSMKHTHPAQQQCTPAKTQHSIPRLRTFSDQRRRAWPTMSTADDKGSWCVWVRYKGKYQKGKKDKKRRPKKEGQKWITFTGCYGEPPS